MEYKEENYNNKPDSYNLIFGVVNSDLVLSSRCKK